MGGKESVSGMLSQKSRETKAVQFTPRGVLTVRVSISEKYQHIYTELENRGQRHRVLRIV